MEFKEEIEKTANGCIKYYGLRNAVAFYYYTKFMTEPKAIHEVASNIKWNIGDMKKEKEEKEKVEVEEEKN